MERRERLGRWLLALVVLTSAASLGAVHTVVLGPVALLAAIATGLLWWDAERIDMRAAAALLVVVAAALLGWTLLQLVPLPRSFLASIAAENADVWARSLSPLRESGPAFASISLDPTATRVQLLRGVTYLAVFLGALRLAQRQTGVAFLERVLVASVVTVAATSVLHPVLGAHKVFGVYEPHEMIAYDPHHVGPMLNTNHLAAYVNIGLLVAFASVIERRAPIPRPIALAVVLLLGATTVWTLSRGGTGAMLLGVLLVAALSVRGKRERLAQAIGPALVLVAAVAGAAMMYLSSFDDTRAKFAHNDLFKVGLTRNAFELLREYGFVGLGRGAFESVFPKVRVGSEYYVYTHPENVFAQWTTEWGVPVAAIAMIAIAWALRPRTALARSRPPAGAWGALVATAVHNLVDFSSELPGVMIALAVCAAIVTGGIGSGKSSRSAWWTRRPRVLAGALAIVTVVVVLATVPFAHHELYEEQRAFRDVGLDRSVTRAAFHDRAREAMRRHPAEAYFPFVGMVRATIARDESILPWAGRTLERSPVYGRAHLLLARSLFVRNPSQARLEYRIACTQDSNTCTLDEALGLVRSYEDAIELVPDGPRGPEVLARLAIAIHARLPSTVVRLDRELVERDPKRIDPVSRMAAAALDDIRDEEVWCSESGRLECLEAGRAAASRLRAAAPDQCEGYALSAELRFVAGEVDGAFKDLDGAVDQVKDRSACARRLLGLAQRDGNRRRIEAALDRLVKLGCEAPAICVENLVYAASIERGRGSTRHALALTRRAWERAPERDDLLIVIAESAAHEGAHGEAFDAYTKLAQRQPAEPKWKALAARERDALAHDVFDRR